MTFLFALLLAGADARFEPAGVRLHDVLHSGALLELRAGALVSGDVLEPVTGLIRVDLGRGFVLALEPGVRATREGGGLRLSAHAPARLNMSTSSESWAVGESVRLAAGEAGWSVEGKALAGELRVSLQGQEDPDAVLRAMQESARRMRESSQRARPPMLRRVFTGSNPFTSNEPAGSEAVRQLSELSITGS